MHSIRTFVLACVAFVFMALTSGPRAEVFVRITVAPPPLPVYVQPVIPGPDYIWSPGYWAWGFDGYYWVPGTWVVAPAIGLLWTPGYWGYSDGIYVWRAGYWGPRVGYYGGINYGCGYGGVGYAGGYWRGGTFAYNTAVTNIGSTHITNVYNKTVIVNNTTVTNVSFNGGNGGTTAQPTGSEKAAALDKHMPATSMQLHHQQTASTNRALFASMNKGRPSVAATARAGQFSGQGIIPAKGVNGPVKSLGTERVTSGLPVTRPPHQFNTATTLQPGFNSARFHGQMPPQHAKRPECRYRGNNPAARRQFCSGRG